MKGNGKLEEKDLIIPVLELMRHNKGVISIGEIKDFMLKEYPLSNIDKTISKTRPNEYIFEQQIRNLTSHKKLEKMGLAENTDGGFKLLPEISDLLKNSSEWLYALISDDKINNQLLKKTISTIDKTKSIIGYHELTNEGELLNRNISLRLRSQKLRNIALSHFSINGTIKCRCCNFDFSIFYGNNYGKYSCIEIHHKKPIFMYTGDDEQKTIKDALSNLLPVCPNCHRIIHKNKIYSDSALNEFSKSISKMGN